MKSRILAAALAVAVAAGLAVAPAAVADAAGGTKVGTIRVRLTTLRDGDFPHGGFVVTANGMTRNVYKSAKTNSRGFAALRVPQGKYTITVQTYLTDYRYAVVSQDYIAIQRGQTKTIGMKMRKGAQITGKVLTPTGSALAGAQVAAFDGKGILRGVTTSDKKGKYRLAGLPTARLRIVFNYRSYADGKSKPANDYGWGYYKGSTYATAKKVRVYAQNKFAAATKTTGISGRVGKGTDLSVTLTTKNSAKGRLLVDHMSGSGRYLSAGSVYAPFVNGRTRSLKVEPGRYRLGVVYAGVTYYYTGEGRPLTRSLASAVYTTFTDAPRSVTLGPRP